MLNGWLRLAAAGTPLRPTAAHVVSVYYEGAVIKRIEGTVVSFHPLFTPISTSSAPDATLGILNSPPSATPAP